MATEPDTRELQFREIFEAERKAWRLRRRIVGQEREDAPALAIEHQQLPGTSPGAGTGSDVVAEEGSPPASPVALLNGPVDSFGLALSGGGIRSATFNLGLLQAMAEQGLLSNLDYLSTVSGGGYIGAWFSAWVKRDGNIRNVEQQLNPSREKQSKAVRDQSVSASSAPSIETAEPEPIRHIRANSNYLAPRPGFFTADSWTLIAIYCRNIFLNSLVLVPTIFACIVLVMLWTTMHMPSNIVIQDYVRALLLASSILFLVYGGNLFRLDMLQARKLCVDVGEFQWKSQLPVGMLVVFTLWICATLALDLSNTDSWLVTFCQLLPIPPYITVPLAAALIHATFNISAFSQLLLLQNVRENCSWVLSGLLAGLTQGILLVVFREAFQHYNQTPLVIAGIKIETVVWQAALGTPLIICIHFLGEAIQLGVLGRIEHQLIRERWSAFLARCMMVAFAWIILYVHVFVIPKLFYISSEPWARAISVVTWLLVTGSSLTVAQGQKGGIPTARRRSWYDYVAMAAPPLFLSGLVAGFSVLIFELLERFRPSFVANAVVLNANTARPASELLLGLGLELVALLGLLGVISAAAGSFVDINIFSLQELYKNRLVRCYLGASRRKTSDGLTRKFGAAFRSWQRPRTPDLLTGIDPADDLPLADLRIAQPDPVVAEWKVDDGRTRAGFKYAHSGPLHLFNLAVNLSRDVELERQERKADSFTLSALHCGSGATGYRVTSKELPNWSPSAGANAEQAPPGYGGGLSIGDAVALSGAAVSPNMGYYSSPMVTALLTLLNLRLGAWRGNPRCDTKWNRFGPYFGWLHIIREMLGISDATSPFVYLSDGGHFDNLGAYELIRRRCKYIVVSDAGEDENGACTELAMLIRKVRVDFGVDIAIDVTQLAIDSTTGFAKRNFAIGKIGYPVTPNEESTTGILIYVKMTMRGNEPTDLLSYRLRNPDFPQQSTLNQFYSESQFESFRHLGYVVGQATFHGNKLKLPEDHPLVVYRCAPDIQVRSTKELGLFFTALQSSHAANPSPTWEQNCIEYDVRYARLRVKLLHKPSLKKLAEEMVWTAKCLSIAEARIFRDGDASDAEKHHQAELKKRFKAWRTAKEKLAEHAWMIEAITLLSQVVDDLQLFQYYRENNREWCRVIRTWASTSIFDRDWDVIKGEFAREFTAYIDELRNDPSWIDLDSMR